jgi:branched-chain amino acid transport system substrate-binding protein
VGVLVLLGLSRVRVVRRSSRTVWLAHVLLGSLLLLALEVVLVGQLIGQVPRHYLELITVAFDVVWWLLPALFLSMAIECFVWKPLERRANQTIPNIVRRLVTFMVFLLAVFGVIAFVFDQRLTSLLATSGVIAMIIGLAIQINISNIFSGIALNLERPFAVGDWIKVAGQDEARVIDMTWRTTRLLKRDNTVLNIPNSVAAESIVVNFHRPNRTYELWIYFHVDPRQPVKRVIKIALDALRANEHVRKQPPPGCRFIGYTGWSAKYVAVPVLENYAKRNVYRGAIMNRLWSELHRAGIEQAVRFEHQVRVQEGDRGLDREGPELEEMLKGVDILRPLPDEAKIRLTRKMREHYFLSGETIIHQGETGDSVFVIAEGVVGVWVEVESGDSIEVDRMGAGTFFGEVALLTGEPRTANVIATTDTRLFEIKRCDLAPLIEGQPEMCEILSEELTRRTLNREAKLRQFRIEEAEKQARYESILSKITRLFGGDATSRVRQEE